MKEISIIGGGIAGLVAAIQITSQGGSAVLHEASSKIVGKLAIHREQAADRGFVGDFVIERHSSSRRQ